MKYTTRLLREVQDKFPDLEPLTSTPEHEVFVLRDLDIGELYQRTCDAARYLNEVRSDLDPPVYVLGYCGDDEPAEGEGGAQ